MKIAIVGYGKMGKIIEQVAVERGHEVTLKINRSNIDDLTVKKYQDQCDVAIDFSTPESGFVNVMQCLSNGWNVISGTTGWNEQLHIAEQKAKDQGAAFLYASNFSLGVNLFFNINKQLARLMNDQTQYDVSMTEIHHTSKKDAPSGTGITLAEQIIEQVDRKMEWCNDQSKSSAQLELRSERIDPAPGTHVITYASDVDEIEIKHTAKSRKGFAFGAVLAAEYIHGKSGIFTMQDVLGLSTK